MSTASPPPPAPEPVVSVRMMTEADLPLLHDWLNRPHIKVWWGEDAPSLEEVLHDYAPRRMALDHETPYIALLGDRPIGFAQSYVALGCGDGWWEDVTDPGLRGIDQFIGEAGLLNQGLGTRMVRALAERLFEDPAVTRIQTDPSPNNPRAIRCYEKAGFRRAGNIITPDGPAVYMLLDRPLP